MPAPGRMLGCEVRNAPANKASYHRRLYDLPGEEVTAMPDRDAPTFVPEPSQGSSDPTQGESDVVQPGATASLADGAQALPDRIGHYQIRRLLGEGGMGVVYEAEQDFPRRTVALKIIRSGYATREILRRFENEAQALGRLQHPGIAQIYEAGTAETPFGKQPYFAMELVEGQPLRAYCEARRLNVRQRLELMAKICDAVQHAHQRGLIHRDLKPANILVDESGQPRILDFGVARLTDSDAQATRQTDIGQLVGTLAYMSPEQVQGDSAEIDTRSDVYALGLVLYELLAGKRPYVVGRELTEAARTIREEEPTALSSVNRTYRGDLDTIVGKALEKDKARRYASAAEMAEDIRRHLSDEPITARPPSASYQLQKFARRNKALVTGLAAVFVVLVLGIVASTWEAVQARRAEAKARQESAIAQAVSDFLRNDLLSQASAYNQSKPDANITVRTALDRAAERIQGRFENQPDVEAAIRETMGNTYADLAQYAESQNQFERALELERQVWGPENPKTLKTLNHLGRTLWHQGKYQEAEALLGGALEIERRVLGPEHPDTLYCMNNLANVYRAQGRDAQAEPLYRQTLEMRRRVLGPEHPDTLLSMGNLAATYAKEGKDAQAQALFVQTLEISRRVLGPEHTRTLDFLLDFASLYEQQGKYTLAEKYDAEVLAGRQRAGASEDPLDVQAAAADLALDYVSEGKFKEGEALARQNLEFNEKKQPDNWQRFRAESLLGASLAGQKKYTEAEPLLVEGYQGMLKRKDRMDVPDQYHLELAHQWLVQLYQTWGKPDKAAEWRKK